MIVDLPNGEYEAAEAAVVKACEEWFDKHKGLFDDKEVLVHLLGVVRRKYLETLHPDRQRMIELFRTT